MQAQQTVAERSDRRRDRRSHIWDLLGDIRGGGGLVASTEILLVRSGACRLTNLDALLALAPGACLAVADEGGEAIVRSCANLWMQAQEWILWRVSRISHCHFSSLPASRPLHVHPRSHDRETSYIFFAVLSSAGTQ